MLDKKKYFMIMVPALILGFLFQFFVPSEQRYLGIVFILAGGVIYYLWVHIEKDKQKDWAHPLSWNPLKKRLLRRFFSDIHC